MTLLRYTDETSQVQELSISEAHIDRSIQDQWTARIFLRRDLLDEGGVVKGETEMYIVDSSSTQNSNARFGGVYRDVNRQGGSTEVLLDSFERYARDATPTGGGERWDNVDDTQIINDGISNIPQVSAGTVNNVASGISMLFTHASPAKKLRETANVAGGELRYNVDKTVDYVETLGTDRSGSITLSPTEQNIEGEFNATKKGGDEDATHIRFLGAGEGEHQTVINMVPDADGASYDNKRTYTSSRWSSGDRRVWDIVSNKDLTDEDALTEFGQNYIEDMDTDGYIDVNTTVRGVDVSIGDIYHVEHSGEQVDTDMSVISMTEKILSNGTEYELTLSTRRNSRMDLSSKDRQDIQRYNKALEGTAVPINASGGRQPVNSSNNYEFKFYYPAEVKYEHRLNVRVMGLEYRAYSQGAASGGGVETTSEAGGVNNDTTSSGGFTSDTTSDGGGGTSTETSTSNSDHGVVLLSDTQTEIAGNTGGSWSTIRTLFEPSEGYELAFIGFATTGAEAVIEVRIKENSGLNMYPGSAGIPLTGTTLPTSETVAPDGTHEHEHGVSDAQIGNGLIPVPGEAGNVEVQYKTSFDPNCNIYLWWYYMGEHTHDVSIDHPLHSHSFEVPDHTHSFDWEHQHLIDLSPHTHGVDPGIIGTGNYPSNCDVLVNGNSMGTSFGGGSGTFEESVDVSGQLNEGQVNTIEVTSGSLGHVQAFVEGDVYRQILGDG